ncbi:DUF317 domain-containing protein [Streptomyces sp. NPDC001858]
MTVAPGGPGFSTTVEALRLRERQLRAGQPTVRGYHLSFDTETPADIVAAAVARVLETSRVR